MMSSVHYLQPRQYVLRFEFETGSKSEPKHSWRVYNESYCNFDGDEQIDGDGKW